MALKQLKRLDKQTADRIDNFLYELTFDANPKKFADRLKGKLSKYYKFRLGSYRILCDIEDNKLKILVVEIGHRKDIYRKAQ